MKRLSTVLAGILVVAAIDAADAQQRPCLSRNEQIAAVTGGQAIPLSRAIRSLRLPAGAEVVHARLCREAEGLAYRLTALAKDGKVTRMIVDARSGALLKRR
jgi:uncharacterized membrane protein YkoI